MNGQVPENRLQDPAQVERATPRSNETSGETLVVPVIAEQIHVDRQRVETGRVRIHKTVTEREEVVDEPVYQEEVEVERVPINRPVDGPVPIRYEGDTMIVPLLEEVMVVEKRLMLKEELHVRKRQFTGPRPQKVVLRSEQAEVERTAPGTAGDAPPGEERRLNPAA